MGISTDVINIDNLTRICPFSSLFRNFFLTFFSPCRLTVSESVHFQQFNSFQGNVNHCFFTILHCGKIQSQAKNGKKTKKISDELEKKIFQIDTTVFSGLLTSY